jgi:hypothetical protein
MSQDPYHGLFTHQVGGRGLSRGSAPPATLPDPQTGRQLRIATIEVSGAICPACARHGQGGFVSFVADLRLAFACPNCQTFVWIAGA